MASDPGGNVPRLNDLDTLPPPDGGDAYGNATVVRAAPSEILEAIRRDREREKGPPGEAKDAKSEKRIESADKSSTGNEKAASPPADSDSTDIEIPQGEPPANVKAPAMDHEALKPARVPQDFDRLMSQRSDASLVGMSAQPKVDDPDDDIVLPTSSRRTTLVVGVVGVVVLLWVTVMAAMAASHCGNG